MHRSSDRQRGRRCGPTRRCARPVRQRVDLVRLAYPEREVVEEVGPTGEECVRGRQGKQRDDAARVARGLVAEGIHRVCPQAHDHRVAVHGPELAPLDLTPESSQQPRCESSSLAAPPPATCPDNTWTSRIQCAAARTRPAMANTTKTVTQNRRRSARCSCACGRPRTHAGGAGVASGPQSCRDHGIGIRQAAHAALHDGRTACHRARARCAAAA